MIACEDSRLSVASGSECQRRLYSQAGEMINAGLLTRQKGPGIMTAINYSQKEYLSISNCSFILHVTLLYFTCYSAFFPLNRLLQNTRRFLFQKRRDLLISTKFCNYKRSKALIIRCN